ncbi:MAG: clostripain-related cysteine peptidase, partial [Odoribacter splanchnicus]
MKKYLLYLTCCLLSLAALSSCNDDNEPSPVPEPDPTPSGYCLMFYMSGGDPEHDILLMESARQAAEATGDGVAVTILMKTSGEGEGEAHNGTRRYTAQDGVLTQDTEFGTVDDFAVTDPTNLAEFIRWSAEQYPDRRYLFAIGGHGASFSPGMDLPDTEEDTPTRRPGTRATLYDNGKVMTSAQLGDAIRQSGVNLEAIIAHSCLQGSIEMLAEWEGTADYLLGSPFSIPDYAYD